MFGDLFGILRRKKTPTEPDLKTGLEVLKKVNRSSDTELKNIVQPLVSSGNMSEIQKKKATEALKNLAKFVFKSENKPIKNAIEQAESLPESKLNQAVDIMRKEKDPTASGKITKNDIKSIRLWMSNEFKSVALFYLLPPLETQLNKIPTVIKALSTILARVEEKLQ